MQYPTEEQVHELIQFINTLPMQYLQNDEPILDTIRRYHADPDVLAKVIEAQSNDVMQRMIRFLTDQEMREQIMSEIPGISSAQDVLELGIKTALAQMFCYASEYQTRFVLPDLLAELRVPDDVSAIGDING